MNNHRWKVWRDNLKAGRVRYKSAEYKCVDCGCWHTVTAKRRNVGYEERNLSLEDLVLNAMRTSATGQCPHKKKRKAKAKQGEKSEDVSKDEPKPQLGAESC